MKENGGHLSDLKPVGDQILPSQSVEILGAAKLWYFVRQPETGTIFI